MSDQDNSLRQRREANDQVRNSGVSEGSESREAEPAAAQIEDEQKRMTAFERSTLRWAKVAVIMAGLAAFFVCLQWWEMRSGAIDTHNLAEASKTQALKMTNVSEASDKIRQAAQDMVTQDQRIADNAQHSLEASNKQSKDALDATIKDFQRDQRAWVGLGQYAIQQFDDKQPFKLVLPFVNSGKSPAILTEQCVAYTIVDHRLTGPPTGYTYQFEKSSAIAPQGAYASTITNRAVPVSYDGITNGTLFLYFFGEFRYHDVYDPAVLHTTDFCLVYDKDAKLMTFCLNGNDMN
jgi:hypothetical protein